MAQLLFPSTLNQDVANRFGNQFMAIFINADSDGKDSSGSDKTPVVKIPEGTALKSIADQRLIQQYLTSDDQATMGTPERGSIRTTKHVIFLPVPMSIKTNYGVKYEPFEFGTKARELAGSAAAWMGGIGAESLMGSAGGTINKFLGKLQDTAELGVTAYGFKERLAFNPHKELLFEGLDFREFDFNWKLIAKNKAESELIRKIILLLRYHMHPDLTGGGYLFKYPSDFDIQFFKIVDGKAVPNEYLTFIATSVLLNLDVDYSGGGEYSSFKDTVAPVEIDLTMKFRETVIITKKLLQDIANVQGGQGLALLGTDEGNGQGDR